MLRSWKLGTAFGIGVYVHWTFLLLLAWVFARTLAGGAVGPAILMLAAAIAVFACVLLHEFGHALAARHFGIRTRDITLFPIGGVARLERLSHRPREEFVIALAGPAVNLAIALGLVVPLALFGYPPAPAALLQAIDNGNLLASLLAANVFLAGFNLLPAFPMDGGRVLRALLSLRVGHERATALAVRIGTYMSFAFFLGGLFVSNPMLMLIAVFVFFAGRQEMASVRQRGWIRQEVVMEAVPSQAAYGAMTPRGFTGYTWDVAARVWIRWDDGRPVQTISLP